MTPALEKAAPVPAEVHASMLWTIQRFRTSMQPSELLHTMLTIPVVQKWLADRESRPSLPDSREERIREDERDRLYTATREEALSNGDSWRQANEAAKWLWRQGAMLPADRARARQRGDNG